MFPWCIRIPGNGLSINNLEPTGRMEKIESMNVAKSSYEAKWDAIGIGASLVCAVHCVLLPVIFTTFTLFGIEILENTWLEAATLLVSMGFGGWAIWKGFKRIHRQKSVLIFFVIGLLLMLGGNFLHATAYEIGLKIVGAILLITAHIKNRRSCRDCEVHSHSANA